VSNKCSHLGLPIQGKTAMFTAVVRLVGPLLRVGLGRQSTLLVTACLLPAHHFHRSSSAPFQQVAAQLNASTINVPLPPRHATDQVKDSCVVCPAHGTAFDLATGEVKGEWCPKVRLSSRPAGLVVCVGLVVCAAVGSEVQHGLCGMRLSMAAAGLACARSTEHNPTTHPLVSHPNHTHTSIHPHTST